MPKEPFGQAITYLRNNIEALRVHLDDGLVPIDNNVCAHHTHPLAGARKTGVRPGMEAVGPTSAPVNAWLA